MMGKPLDFASPVLKGYFFFLLKETKSNSLRFKLSYFNFLMIFCGLKENHLIHAGSLILGLNLYEDNLLGRWWNSFSVKSSVL